LFALKPELLKLLEQASENIDFNATKQLPSIDKVRSLRQQLACRFW
jgi:hypothetical protein